MATSTPAEFAAKLGRASRHVKDVQTKAITARGLVTKRHILEAAAMRTRQVRPSWVNVKVEDGVARVRLRGGFAYLTELGSHKAPGGWPEVPHQHSARQKRIAARIATFTLAEEKHAILTPEGPRASVMHPALKPRPFWKKGLATAREPGRKAYQRVVNETFTAALH